MNARLLVAAATALLGLLPAAQASAAPPVHVHASLSVVAPATAFCAPPPAPVFRGPFHDGRETYWLAREDIEVCPSGSGTWSIDATSTPFSNGRRTLPGGITSVDSPPEAICQIDVTCDPARTGATYPWVLPAGQPQPPLVSFFSALPGTGTGAQVVAVEWTLRPPRRLPPSYYTAQWVISVVAGP